MRTRHRFYQEMGLELDESVDVDAVEEYYNQFA
jgi:hypothetical protein